MIERCVTLTKYSFSLDGEDFAEGYVVSDDEYRGGRLFRLGSLHCGNRLPIPEGSFVEAQMDGEDADGKLMFQGGRFLLSMRDRASYQLPEGSNGPNWDQEDPRIG